MVAIALGTFLGQFEASVMVLLMVTGGEALEDYAMKSANRDVEAVLEKARCLFYLKISVLFVRIVCLFVCLFVYLFVVFALFFAHFSFFVFCFFCRLIASISLLYTYFDRDQI